MCTGTSVILPLYDALSAPSVEQIGAAAYNWKTHVSAELLVEWRLRFRLRKRLDVILGKALTDKLFLCYGPRINKFDNGVSDPCVARSLNFDSYLLIRNQHRLDFKIVAVSRLVDESLSETCLDLLKLYLVTRTPVIAALVKSKLQSLLLPGPAVIKLGGDVQPVHGYSNPCHPTRGNKRKLLPDSPNAAEIADENEFQAAFFASSIAPSSKKL